MNHSGVELPSNRKFGFFFTSVFSTATAYFYYLNNDALFYIFGALCASFLIVTLIKPDILLSLNKLWMRLGLLLGMLISPLVMGVIFFGIFTPIAILMRLLQRDELRLRFKKQSSYWARRESEAQSASFKNQF